MERWTWRRPAAVAMALYFTLAQAVPLSWANEYLRGAATTESDAATRIQQDAGWDVATQLPALQAEARRLAEALPSRNQRAAHEFANVAASPAMVDIVDERLQAEFGLKTLILVSENAGHLSVQVQYQDAAPNPRVDRRIVDIVSDVIRLQQLEAGIKAKLEQLGTPADIVVIRSGTVKGAAVEMAYDPIARVPGDTGPMGTLTLDLGTEATEAHALWRVIRTPWGLPPGAIPASIGMAVGAYARERGIDEPVSGAPKDAAGSPGNVFNILQAQGPLTRAGVAQAAGRSVATIRDDITALRRWNLLTVSGRGDATTYALTDAARAKAAELLPVIRTVRASRDRATWDAVAPEIARILGATAAPASPVDLARLQASTANPNAPELYLGALVPHADSVPALLASLEGVVRVDDAGRVQVVNEAQLRAETVHQLAAEAFLSTDADVKASAQWLLRQIGRELGVAEASAFALHQAKAAGRWGQATIPAFNIRTGPPHHTLMALFDAAIEQNVGLVMFEIAKSEQGYAVDIEEYVAQVYAAAIARGFTGPLFIQADHYQVAPADYNAKDPEGAAPGTAKKKAVDAMKKHLRRSIEAGMLNLDPDSSTLVDHKIVEQQILPLKVRYTNRYIQARMAEQNGAFAQWIAAHGGLKAGLGIEVEDAKAEGGRRPARIFDEHPVIRALRHKVWDDLLIVSLESAGTQMLTAVLGPDAMALPDLGAYLEQMDLTVEEEKQRYVNPVTGEGRSYNSPELYGMTAKGYHDSLQGILNAGELGELIGLYRDIQKDNLTVSTELLVDARKFARERGHTMPHDISYEEEHTDNEVLVNEHPSSALGATVFTGLADALAAKAKVESFTTLALQTGTMHGVGGDPDWGIHVRVNLMIAGYGKAGTDQHGTSTINADRFADMPTAGVLSDHLATEYQKYTFAAMAQDPGLVDQLGAFFEGVLFWDTPITDPAIADKIKNAKGKPSGDKLKKFAAAWTQAMQEGEAAGLTRRQIIANIITDSKDLGKVKGKLKDVTKLASKPFAVEISQLPPELKAQNYLRHAEEFSRIFRVQNVGNTRAIVEQHAGFNIANVVLPSPPAGLMQSLRRAQSREQAQQLANQRMTTASRRAEELPAAAGKNNTTAIGAGTIQLRGDTSVPKGDKDTAAEVASDAVTIARGDVEHVMAIEGALDVSYDELQAGGVHETGFVVNPHGTGEHVFVVRDDIEVTNGFHTNREGRPHDPSTSNPGGTSLRAWGQAVQRHGVVPEKYAAIVAANVPPAKVASYDQQPLDPFAWDPVNPYDGLLATVARLTGDSDREIWDTEVVIMKRGRESAIKSALQRIANEHPGPQGQKLLITEVSDGTVDPARLAMAGRTEGRYLIAIEMGKSTEGAHNWFESSALRYRGGVIGMRPVSKNINHVMETGTGKVAVKDGATDHSARLNWTSAEARDERTFRPQDAEARLAGKALYHQGNVPGDVEIAVGIRTDNPWFNIPGDLDMGDGDTVRTFTLRMSSAEARAGDGDLWVEVDDVSRREVQRMIRNSAFESLPESARLQVAANVVSELVREGLLAADSQATIETIRDVVARSHNEYRGKSSKVSAEDAVQQIAQLLGAEAAQERIAGIMGTLHRPVQPPNGGSTMAGPAGMSPMVLDRIRGEFREMPDVRMTAAETARISGFSEAVASEALGQLEAAGFLVSRNGVYSWNAQYVPDGSSTMAGPVERPSMSGRADEAVPGDDVVLADVTVVDGDAGADVDDVAEPVPANERQDLGALSYLDRVEALGVEADNAGRLEQSALVNQFPEVANALLTPDEAASAVDIRDRRVIVIHSSVYDAADAAAVQARITEQLQYVLGGAPSAVQFMLAVDGAADQAEAEQVAAALGQALDVTFDSAVPANSEVLQMARPDNRIASVVGPQPFVESVQLAQDRHYNTVAGVVFEPATDEGKVVSGGNAIRTAVAAVTSNEGKPSPALAARLDVLEEDGLFVPQPMTVLAETTEAVQAHQQRMRSVRAAGEKS